MLIRDIHGSIGTAGTRDLKHLMHKNAYISLMISFIDHMETADKCVAGDVHEIRAINGNAERAGTHPNIADECIGIKINAYIPGAVIGPFELAVNPYANLVFGTPGIGEIVEPDVRIVEIVY